MPQQATRAPPDRPDRRDINWSHADHDFDWARTPALPRHLSGVFTEEPRWSDARWARSGAQTTVRDPRFRDLVAELAAPLRGVPKDDLIGEDIRQHHRLNHWRNVALALTTLLLVIAVAAGVVAFVQRTEAIDQRNAAIEQRNQTERSQSRALAALANAEGGTGSAAVALRVALAGLPQSIVKPDRAHALEAEFAALQALWKLRSFAASTRRIL